MIRSLLVVLVAGFFLDGRASAIHVEAVDHVGKHAVLYRYTDYFSMRPEVVGVATVNDSGHVRFEHTFQEIELVQLKIDMLVADFFVEPDAEYTIRFEQPNEGSARSISGATKVNPLFIGLDRFDINALLTDMNGHIAAFLAREYGKEKAKDQEGAHKEHYEAPLKDTLITVRSTRALRIDTFETRLTNFYSEVPHPFFTSQLEYAVAQLRLTPEHDRDRLYERYVEDRPIGYRSPEYVKFFKQFYGKHLLQFIYSSKPDELKAAVRSGEFPAVLDLADSHDFLQNERIAELVVLHELYLEWGNEAFTRTGILNCLEEQSLADPHLTIAQNMIWDRTTMQQGSTLSDDLVLQDADGKEVAKTVLDSGIVFLAVSAGWCTYCEQETQALSKLADEYGEHIRFVIIGVGDDLESDFRNNPAMHPIGVESYYAGHDPLILDKLRLRSIPSFFLMEEGILKQAPADAPSQGVAREFHRIQTVLMKDGKVKVWDD